MTAAEEELERLLDRCRERLGDISLSLPELEAEAPPPPPVLRLDPEPEPRAAPPPAEPEPAPAAREPAPPPAAPEDAPAPVHEFEESEPEVFPPPGRAESPAETPRPTPTPVPEAPSRWGWGLALTAAAAAAAGAGAWWSRRPVEELTVPLPKADALAVRPDSLQVAEGRELVTLSRHGRALSRETLDAPVASLRWDGGSLWSVDGKAAEVLERRPGARPTVFHLNHVPVALFVNGKYLWTVDRDHALHQFLISRSILGVLLQPLDLYDLGRLAPETFAVGEDGTLWLVDSDSRRLYRMTLVGGAYKPVASAPLSTLAGPEGILRGLSVEGDALWLLSADPSGRAVLRRMPLDRLAWRAAS